MSDATPATAKGNRRRALIIGGGAAGGYLVWRWLRGRSAGAAQQLSTAASGGGSIPAGTSGAGSSGASAAPQSISQWLQAAMAYGSNPIAVFNAATNWLNGNCVDQGGYGGLTAAISALGLPPGFSMPPVLTVCAGGNQGTGSSPAGGGTGTSTGGSGGTSSSAGGGGSAPTPNQPAAAPYGPLPSGAVSGGYGLGALAFPGSSGLPKAPYPGAPVSGLVPAAAVPGQVYQPPGSLPVPAGGYAAVVGNTQVGVMPAWQAANNAAIAAGLPIPFPTPPPGS